LLLFRNFYKFKIALFEGAGQQGRGLGVVVSKFLGSLRFFSLFSIACLLLLSRDDNDDGGKDLDNVAKLFFILSLIKLERLSLEKLFSLVLHFIVAQELGCLKC
jgi:hypothetical protein